MAQTLKQTIKLTLRTINHALKQLPTDKKMILAGRVNDVMKKYPTISDSTNQLTSLKQQLEFNLNFIKLSNPQLDFTPKQEVEEEKQAKEEPQLKQDQHFSYEIPKDFDIDEVNMKFQGSRQQVEFMNWFDGNADPSQLRKHKELLKRQHYSGDHWKGKQIPQSQVKDYMLEALANKPEKPPEKTKLVKDLEVKIDESDELWEKVKR